nr:hypothetical protein [candidate division Zixibacteria bacterium]
MRSKFSLPGFGLVLMAILALMFAGCSDDSTTVIYDDSLTNGDPEDPEFLLVQDRVNDFFTQTQEDFLLGFENIYQLPTDTEEVRNMYGPMGPEDIVNYVYANGWHITYVERNNAYFNDFFHDSVQFQIDSEPVEEPTGLDLLHYIRYCGYATNVTDETHTDYNGHVDLIFEDLDTETCTINGTNSKLLEYTYICPESTVVSTYDFDNTISDVNVNEVPSYGWSGSYPVTGEMVITVAQVRDVDYGSGSQITVRNWSVSVEIEDGVAAVRVVSDDLVWDYEMEL